MELISVRRVVCFTFLQLERLNPEHRAVDLEVTGKMVERYQFLKYPKTYEDFNNVKDGIAFQGGAWNGIAIDDARFFPQGLGLSTGKSTIFAEELAADIMTIWPEVGLMFSPDWVTARRHNSELVVSSSVDLCNLNPRISAVASEYFENAGPGIAGFYVDSNADTFPVQIQRLLGAPLSANQYWSQAPLSTDRHLSFLESIERVLA